MEEVGQQDALDPVLVLSTSFLCLFLFLLCLYLYLYPFALTYYDSYSVSDLCYDYVFSICFYFYCYSGFCAASSYFGCATD